MEGGYPLALTTVRFRQITTVCEFGSERIVRPTPAGDRKSWVVKGIGVRVRPWVARPGRDSGQSRGAGRYSHGLGPRASSQYRQKRQAAKLIPGRVPLQQRPATLSSFPNGPCPRRPWPQVTPGLCPPFGFWGPVTSLSGGWGARWAPNRAGPENTRRTCRKARHSTRLSSRPPHVSRESRSERKRTSRS